MESDGKEEKDQSLLQGKYLEEMNTYEPVVEKKKKKKKKKEGLEKKNSLENKKEKHLTRVADTVNEDREEGSQRINVGDDAVNFFHQRFKKLKNPKLEDSNALDHKEHQKCKSRDLKSSGNKRDWKRKRPTDSDSSDFLGLELPKKRLIDRSVEEILSIEKRLDHSLTPAHARERSKEKIRRKLLMQARQERARSQL